MIYIKAHLNWSYGIALLIGLLCAVLAVVLNTWYLAIVFFVAIYSGEYVLWVKGKKTIPAIIRMMIPIYVVVVLWMKNDTK